MVVTEKKTTPNLNVVVVTAKLTGWILFLKKKTTIDTAQVWPLYSTLQDFYMIGIDNSVPFLAVVSLKKEIQY